MIPLNHRHAARKILALFCVFSIVISLTGCPSSDWERKTFQVLSSSNGVIRTGIAEYNGSQSRPTSIYNTLNQAKAFHNLATQSFASYWKVKVAVQSTIADCAAKRQSGDVCTTAQGKLNASIAGVDKAILQLTPLIASIKALKIPAAGGIGAQPGPPIS